MNRVPVIAIIGPTAVGKTMFSLELADKLGAEVISVDSRQVYRYLDVGTDKVSLAMRRHIIHHLIDIADPDEIYSAADFAQDAAAAGKRITARGRVPLFIGGTAFYYKALCGMLSDELPRDENVRRQLESEAKEKGLSLVYDELAMIDAGAASKIHPNDQVRIIRALEIFRITGRNATWWYQNQNKIVNPYDMLYIGLLRCRDDLYRNIEERVRKQFASGYPEEVEWLLCHGYSEKLPALQGFGYRELVQYLNGNCTFDEAAIGDIRATKAFSRRQMTWFKHFKPTLWYDLGERSVSEIIADVLPKCIEHLTKEG